MRLRMYSACLALALTAAAATARGADGASSRKIDPWVLATAAERGQTEFLVMLRDQADLRGAATIARKSERGAFVADTLSAHAAATQAPLLRFLEERGAAHRAYWVANMVWVRGDGALVEAIAARDDVYHVYANPRVKLNDPVSRTDDPPGRAVNAIEWGVSKIHAPDVWALGYTGQGVVVGGQDTGYDWEHPAIKDKYRGWNGSTADHDYNWHDSIHSGGGVCGADSDEPCDDDAHGTHTMGTMVGDDGAGNQVGVAPGARWIGCRNMDQGAGTPATYSECFEWFIAPTTVAGNAPDPSKAPDVINNSWGCPPSEGCTEPDVLKTVVENTRAAGIEVVVSAGNAGSSCGTVEDPAAIYAASFSIGATDSSDNIADFSSRGPVTIDGSNRMKPAVSAPGVGVRSSVPGGGYSSFSGTSMAGPHVVGLVALLLSANPGVAGNPDEIEPLITSSAVPRTSSETCGGVPGDQIPNNTYGWGRVDALAAVNNTRADLGIAQEVAPSPTLIGVPIHYAITVSNDGPAAASAASTAQTLSLQAIINAAVPSQGGCTLLPHAVTCELGAIPVGGTATIAVTITPTAIGTITSLLSVAGSGADPVGGNNTSTVLTSVVACPFAAPVIDAPASVPAATDGLAATSTMGGGHTGAWTLDGGTITSGQGTASITFESGAAGSVMELSLADTLGECEVDAAPVKISVDFDDVPPANPFHDAVNTARWHEITGGCGTGIYCPGNPVTRAQMAVFLLKAKFGASHQPPEASGTMFGDVAKGSFAADWIEELASLGITSGCSGGNYCPDAPVTRAQMAVFLLKAKEGSAYAPPAAAGIFGDVPVGAFADAWIEELYARSVTGGCSAAPLLYCPGNANTRGQMAVFMVKTFSLD